MLVGLGFLLNFPFGSLRERGQVATISGAVYLLSVTGAVAEAFGLTRIQGLLARPVTGLGTVSAYLILGGLDVVIAHAVAGHTSIGRRQ